MRKSKSHLGSTSRKSHLGRNLLRSMSSTRGLKSASRRRPRGHSSLRSRMGSRRSEDPVPMVVAPSSSSDDDMNILDSRGSSVFEGELPPSSTDVHHELPPQKSRSEAKNLRVSMTSMNSMIPPPPLSTTPRPPRTPDDGKPPPLKPRPKSLGRKKPPPVKPRPKSIDRKRRPQPPVRPRGDSYSDRQRARRGSVVAYTKGRRGSVVTYSESALKETVVRPSANLYAIASRRHLDTNQNENKGEASMDIQLSASLPVQGSPKVIETDDSMQGFRRYSTSADINAAKARQLSEKSLYKDFVKQRMRRSREFENTIATRISYAIVRALEIHRSDDSGDVMMAGTGKKGGEKRNVAPLGCDIDFDERAQHKLKTSDCTISVKAYFPSAFAAIRNIYEIKYSKFKDSMSVLEGGSEGQGKSKQLFFFSHDKKYVIKTVKRHELQLMKDLIESYFYHHAANPDTLLCRFYGLYKVKLMSGFLNMSSEEYIVIVMNNCMRVPPIFSKPCQVYDLKGSSKGRITPWKAFKNGMVGKEHNFNGKALRENGIKGPDSMYLSPESASKLMRQLDVDAFWLRSCNIMDYSLLLGVYKIPKGLGSLTTIDLNVKHDSDGTYMAWFQRWYGGVRGSSEQGQDYLYTFGVIDILQSYSWKKAAETFGRAGRHNDYTECEVSAIPSNDYAVRFVRYIRSKIRSGS